MQVDRKHVSKLLNNQISAMFATWKEAKIPDKAIDAIVAHDKEGLNNAIAYLRESDLPDNERALRANIISWTISTIALAAELGLVLEKNEQEQGQLPSFKKDEPTS